MAADERRSTQMKTRVRVNITIDEPLLRDLDRAVRRYQTSRSALIREALKLCSTKGLKTPMGFGAEAMEHGINVRSGGSVKSLEGRYYA